MSNNDILTITDDFGNSFLFMYGGSDLYWVNNNYKEDNEFIFTENNSFYSSLCELFSEYESDTTIEWISEAYGEREESHRLTIEKRDGLFNMKFIQNELNMYRLKDLCPICFCLSGSNNPKFVMKVSNGITNTL